MIGIQLIRILDVAELNAIENVRGVSPRTVLIRGKDFRAVEQVVMHGYDSPSVVVVSSTELLAEVPAPLAQTTITDVTVLSSNFTLTDRSLLVLGIGKRVKKVSGILRLLQTYVRLLIRTPGSDIFNKTLGGGGLRSIGKSMTNLVVSDVAVAIRKTTADITAVQSRTPQIPPSERLLSAEITSFYADPGTATISVTISLTNHAGQNAQTTIAM